MPSLRHLAAKTSMARDHLRGDRPSERFDESAEFQKCMAAYGVVPDLIPQPGSRPLCGGHGRVR